MLNKQTTRHIRGGLTEEVILTLDFQVGVTVEVKDVKGPFRLKTDGTEAAAKMIVRLILWACESPRENKEG